MRTYQVFRNISLLIDITCFLLFLEPNKPNSRTLLTTNLAANYQLLPVGFWVPSVPLQPPLTRATPPTPFPVVTGRTRKGVYINKIQQDTLHVSGVYRTHHQEYIKL